MVTEFGTAVYRFAIHSLDCIVASHISHGEYRYSVSVVLVLVNSGIGLSLFGMHQNRVLPLLSTADLFSELTLLEFLWQLGK